MTREQLIECIANAVEQGPGRTLPPYRKMAEHVLDALTAAGMVVVPREFVIKPCNCSAEGFGMCVDHGLKGGCIRFKARAMTEAANG